MGIPKFMKKMVVDANDKIIDEMNKNRQKLQKIDLYMTEFNIKDINETDFVHIKNYIEWSSKELKSLYDNYEKLLKKTTEQINQS